MTQDEYKQIVEAARERAPHHTPAPWEWGGEEDEHQIVFATPYTVVASVGETEFGHQIVMSNIPDQDLITAAPDLNAALIAADDRIKALEAELAQVRAENERLNNLFAAKVISGDVIIGGQFSLDDIED